MPWHIESPRQHTGVPPHKVVGVLRNDIAFGFCLCSLGMQEVSNIRMCGCNEVDSVCADPRKVHGRRVC